MEFDFFKLRVCRNDLILVSFLQGNPPEASVLSPLSRRLCNRIRGVGGSGVVYLLTKRGDRFLVRHYTPDGDESSLYPDALIGACRYLFDSGFSGPETVQFIESGRDHDIRVIDSNHFSVRLGVPLRYDESSVSEEPGTEYTRDIHRGGKTFVTTPLTLLRPVSAVFLDEDSPDDLHGLSDELLKESENLPIGQPVFIRVYSREDIRIHVFFDAKGRDYISCAGAAVVAAVVNGFCDRQVLVRIGRDDLYVQWNEATNEVSVAAAAVYAFSGFFYFDETINTTI